MLTEDNRTCLAFV